jgi:hypothetical protein
MLVTIRAPLDACCSTVYSKHYQFGFPYAAIVAPNVRVFVLFKKIDDKKLKQKCILMLIFTAPHVTIEFELAAQSMLNTLDECSLNVCATCQLVPDLAYMNTSFELGERAISVN